MYFIGLNYHDLRRVEIVFIIIIYIPEEVVILRSIFGVSLLARCREGSELKKIRSLLAKVNK